MKKSLSFLFFASVTLSGCEPSLPADAKDQLFSALAESTCALVDIHKGAIGTGNPSLEKNLFALRDLGILKIQGSWVSMVDPIDARAIIVKGGNPCLRTTDYSKLSLDIARTENVKSTTGRAGIIAYAQMTGDRQDMPFYSRFREATGQSNNGTNKANSSFRILFLEDPFSGKMKLVDHDAYVNGNPLSKRVIEALAK